MKRVLLIHTGGTLGMELSGEPSDQERFLQSLKKNCPEIFEHAEIGLEVLFNKDSSNIHPRDWIMIGDCIHQQLANWDAFVVIHGTDTMAFTASALSYMLPGIQKPVILTGSQRPLIDPRSDAPRNLINAVELAAEGRCREIMIFFDSVLLRGNRAKKVSVSSFGAFESPNFPAIANVGAKVEWTMPESRTTPYSYDPRIETHVASVHLFPGLSVEILLPLLSQRIKGLIVHGFGPGDIPLGESSILHLIRSATEMGVPCVICSQAIYGSVDLNLYATGRNALEAGAISAGDMTWEASLTKMMVLVGRGAGRNRFISDFEASLAGERSL
jgi:L-asparaginase